MRRPRRFESWAEDAGADVEVIEEWAGERIYAVFEWSSILPWAERNPVAYVKTSPFADEFWVETGDSLEMTIEKWQEPGQQDYQIRKFVDATGPSGAESHFDTWDNELTIREVAEDGWNRVITVKV